MIVIVIVFGIVIVIVIVVVTRVVAAGSFLEHTEVDIQSVRLEPYLLRSSNYDRILVALEVIFMFWLGISLCDYLIFSRNQVQRFGLKALFGFWSVVDVSFFFVMFVFLAHRLAFVLLVFGNPLRVPTNKYPSVIEDAASISRNQITVSFFNIGCALVRFFKFYRFQGSSIQIRLSNAFFRYMLDLIKRSRAS